MSFDDTVDDMLAEADHRAHAADVGITVNHTNQKNRLYKSYQALLRWIPSIHQVPQMDLKGVLQQLGKGADSGCNKDTHRLKVLVIHWLMEGIPKPDPPLSISDKSGRGFYNDATGKLLCPVDYDWNNLSHWQNIRDFHPNFPVNALSWPAFLYDNGQFNPKDPAKGLFKDAWLVRAFRAIFISPSSTDDLGNDPQELRPSRKCRRGDRWTRANIANLIALLCPVIVWIMGSCQWHVQLP
ncbi:hypothetical protein J3R83DRAFT_13275 [Lanmaoa asiatica]|nr:hypothetical protein J3R83DRAFT_13275 [Lanmaoa asiatica]